MFFSDYKNHPVFEVDKALLWEYDVTRLDYTKIRIEIVTRVIERGTFHDFYAILNIYGEDGVRDAIKKISYLSDIDMNFASLVFNIPFNELKCYSKKQLQGKHIYF